MTGVEAITPILALSVLLAVGFAAACLARLVRLPSVTGYLVGGIVIGPAGLDLVPEDLLQTQLRVFTSIALMLVAFGIGERFDLQQLRQSARAVTRISLLESAATFLLVALAVGFASRAAAESLPVSTSVAIALVAAAIAVATAPASTAAVIRELRATGSISRLTLASVVVNNALSITLFGLAAAGARLLLGTTPLGIGPLAQPLLETAAALLLGLAVGLLTDLVVHRLTRPPDVLIVALASVFFIGGLASFLGLSPLLAGVAAGFAVVNRDRRDVRAFRALNDFEPPLYAIFFALAGAELRWSELVAAGFVGLSFVLARAVGKYFGARFGAQSSGLSSLQSSLIGLGLLQQAGLAIGLALLVSQDATLASIRVIVINITVASVVINELVGPPLLRLVLLRVGESAAPEEPPEPSRVDLVQEIDLSPWRKPQLAPDPDPAGRVLVALGNRATAAGLVRISVLIAHGLHALPRAVYIATHPAAPADFWSQADLAEANDRFRIGEVEAAEMGYQLETRLRYAPTVADGILSAAATTSNTLAIVLGHPLARRARLFGRVVDAVAQRSPAPVIVAKFVNPFQFDRLLVPVVNEQDFDLLFPFVSAFASVADSRITVLRILPHDASTGDETGSVEQDPQTIAFCHRLPGRVECEAVAPISRVNTIVQASEAHDLVIMGTGAATGISKLFFGSLAEDVAVRTRRPMLVVCEGAKPPVEARPA